MSKSHVRSETDQQVKRLCYRTASLMKASLIGSYRALFETVVLKSLKLHCKRTNSLDYGIEQERNCDLSVSNNHYGFHFYYT